METIEIIPESIELIRISDEEYFSEKYEHYISNSRLSLINPEQGGSFEKYEKGFDNAYSNSFELGSAVHAMFLQKGEFELSNIIKPSGKLGVFADEVLKLSVTETEIDKEFYRKAAKKADYYANSLTDNRLMTALDKCESYWILRNEEEKKDIEQIYLSEANLYKTNECLRSLNNNHEIYKVLNPSTIAEPIQSFNEYALLADVKVTIDGEETILPIKAKLDNFIINDESGEIILNDLKTTGRPVEYFMGNHITDGNGDKVWIKGSFEKYHYYRQMGMYLWMLASYYKHQGYDYKLKANMIVVESFDNPKSAVYKVYDKHIKFGLKELKKLLIEVVKWKNQK